MLTRKSNWQSALAEYLTASAGVRFAYGVFDCGLFVAGAVTAMTGVDVVPGVRGSYGDRRAALGQVCAICGAKTMERLAEYLTAKYGMPEVNPRLAQRGDAVLLRHGRTSSLGLVAMHGTEILTPYRGGLLRLPLEHATRAWHI